MKKSREEAKAAATQRKGQQEKSVIPTGPKNSELLDTLLPDRLVAWKAANKRNRKRTVIDLVNFSFIDHPRQTIAKLRQIAEAECFASRLYINFSDRDVLDIGPYLVLGNMLNNMAPIVNGGQISFLAQQAFAAVGLQELLGMRFNSLTRHVTDIWPYALRQKAPNSQDAPNLAMSPARQEKVAESFGDTINEWLRQLEQPRVLTPEAYGNVVRLIGEALNNAERHSQSGSDGHWAIAGLMSRRDTLESSGVPGNSTFICRASIFSLGNTISSTISNAADEVVQRDLVNYTRRAAAGPNSTNEELATVYALQDGVSCRPTESELGGVGMMDMADFTVDLSEDLGAGLSEMAILSGQSFVAFRGDYARGRRDPVSGRRLQWFNPEQRWDLPPDPNYVMRLPFRIPGTVISLRFGIGPDMLDASGQE
ncbi:MAG: hypothetical protein JNL25_07920 [Rhodospirillaceae bacterium]|nr:hypothetical protein [Rhodospirillaceae bacterium]